VDFPLDQYRRMAELAKGIKGKMIISVNDIPEAGLTMESLPIIYTVGGAGKGGKTAELVIRNW
jgi:DNA adenine methylase